MSKFSVKKPLTVFVAVVAILVLGVVSYFKMTPDLLPNMNFPYVVIVTTYPGASPEKVEAEVSKPMEQSMSTLEHIKEVTSTSSENVSMIMLEFADSVNMDTIGVDIQQKITTLSAGWSDMVRAPYVLKINPSMLPIEVAALSMEGKDTIALTEFVNDTLMNKLEGIPGVARISTSGMVEQQLHVVLDQNMIDAVNRKVQNAVNQKLDDAAQELKDKQDELESAKGQIAGAESMLTQGADAMAQGTAQIQSQKTAMQATIDTMSALIASEQSQRQSLFTSYSSLVNLDQQITNAAAHVRKAQANLENLLAQQEATTPTVPPTQPTLPETPTQPTQPTQPETPTQPTQPETPTQPTQPTQPETPTQPTQPAQPEIPTQPTQPAQPETPTQPTQPAQPETPTQPTQPAQPETPTQPTQPTITETPTQPTQPIVLPTQPPVPAAEPTMEAAPVSFVQAVPSAPVTVDLGFGIRTVVSADTDMPRLHLLAEESEESLEDQIQTAKSALISAQSQYDSLISLMQSTTGCTTPEELKAKIQDQKVSLDALDAEISMNQKILAAAKTGMLTIDQLSALVEQQKISGTLQMSLAAGKLAASSISIEAGLSQIESGLESLEDSRDGALRKADLKNIITMDMITKILTAQNFSMPAGYVEQDGINYMVSVGDEIRDLETLRNLLLMDLDMEGVDPIYLKDVAIVTVTDTRDETYARLNGAPSVVLSFEKQSTFATAEVTNNIQDKFQQLEDEYPGLNFVSLMNQGDYIYMIVNSILSSLLLGAVFATIVLWLFLRDLRPTFITLCSIPISVIFAVVLMYFSGITINMISLSGLAVAVGMLVDNSVVVIENIYRLRSKGANVIQAAVSGAMQVAGAVTASTLTTVCVFVPIVFVEGITRQLFTDLALTMTYALLASLIVSLTLVPAMASGLLRRERLQKQGWLERKMLPLYEDAVRWILHYKWLVLSLSALLLVVSTLAALSRGFIFMPAMDSSEISLSIDMPEEVDMDTAVRLADEVLAEVQQIEGVKTVGAMMGSSGLGMMGGGNSSHNVTAYITLADENASGIAVGKEIEERCAGMECTVTASASMMDMSALTGSGISVNIYAEDMDVLQEAARNIAETLRGIQGIAEVSDGLEDAAPALHVAIDRNKAMKHGLTVAQIFMEISSGLTKTGTVASMELDGISTEVIIEKPKGAVLDANDLRSYVFEITKEDDKVEKVPLTDFAVVEDTTSLTSIKRVGQRRCLTVTATPQEGYNVTLLTRQAQDALSDMDLGKGISYRFSGENETIMESMQQLLLMLLLGMLLVYLIMVAQFQSLKSPFIVMFTIPLAFTGGFLALLVCGMNVSIISMIGFIMLTGIIVNNGIVLVDYINQLRLEGMERQDAIVTAGSTRMRPILMTTITTILGLMDMALRKSAGTALMRPIAVVCIGGLVYATLMTLFVVPCIYDMLNKKELRKVSDEDLKVLDL